MKKQIVLLVLFLMVLSVAAAPFKMKLEKGMSKKYHLKIIELSTTYATDKKHKVKERICMELDFTAKVKRLWRKGGAQIELDFSEVKADIKDKETQNLQRSQYWFCIKPSQLPFLKLLKTESLKINVSDQAIVEEFKGRRCLEKKLHKIYVGRMNDEKLEKKYSDQLMGQARNVLRDSHIIELIKLIDFSIPMKEIAPGFSWEENRHAMIPHPIAYKTKVTCDKIENGLMYFKVKSQITPDKNTNEFNEIVLLRTVNMSGTETGELTLFESDGWVKHCRRVVKLKGVVTDKATTVKDSINSSRVSTNYIYKLDAVEN